MAHMDPKQVTQSFVLSGFEFFFLLEPEVESLMPGLRRTDAKILRSDCRRHNRRALPALILVHSNQGLQEGQYSQNGLRSRLQKRSGYNDGTHEWVLQSDRLRHPLRLGLVQ
jgi:hypothetical protein